MNFVFLSPQFPPVYWQFCAALRRDGARVLGIGDTPFEQLAPEVSSSLDEYYWVHDLEDYDRARFAGLTGEERDQYAALWARIQDNMRRVLE